MSVRPVSVPRHLAQQKAHTTQTLEGRGYMGNEKGICPELVPCLSWGLLHHPGPGLGFVSSVPRLLAFLFDKHHTTGRLDLPLSDIRAADHGLHILCVYIYPFPANTCVCVLSLLPRALVKVLTVPTLQRRKWRLREVRSFVSGPWGRTRVKFPLALLQNNGYLPSLPPPPHHHHHTPNTHACHNTLCCL